MMDYTNMVENIAYDWESGVRYGLIKHNPDENNDWFAGKVRGMLEATALMAGKSIPQVTDDVLAYSNRHGLMLHEYPLM